MKIKIAFTENERKQAENITSWIKFFCRSSGKVTAKESRKHEPFHHIYMNVKTKKS